MPPVPAAPPAPAPPPAVETPVSAGEKVATIRGAASTRGRVRQAAQGTAQLQMPKASVSTTPSSGGPTGLNIPTSK
jgi:hypothetical protein